MFKVSKREGCQSCETLAELCLKMGLSDRVCQACVRKIRNAFQLYSFISLSLQRSVETTLIASPDVADSRLERLLPSSVSSPERSPQARKGQKTAVKRSVAKKSLSFKEPLPSSSHHDGQSLMSKEEFVAPLTADEIALARLNVEELIDNTTTEVKVVVVSPNGQIESFPSSTII